MSESDRFERLEGQVTTLKRLVAALLLLALAAVALGAAQSQPGELVVKRLRVVDEKGLERAVLGIDPSDTAGLVFKDGAGDPRQVLGTNGNGDSTCLLRDRDGTGRLVWNTLPEGLMAWTMLSGKPGHSLRTTTDKAGTVITVYEVGPAEQDRIFIGIDRNGRVVMSAPTREDAE